MNSGDHKHFVYDKIGVAISVICMLHCLAPPLLILVFPLVTALGAFETWIHLGLAAIMVPVAYWATRQGYQHHRSKIVPILAIAGVSLFLFSLTMSFLPDLNGVHHHGQKPLEISTGLAMSLLGSLMVSLAHILNFYYCRPASTSHKCHHH